MTIQSDPKKYRSSSGKGVVIMTQRPEDFTAYTQTIFLCIIKISIGPPLCDKSDLGALDNRVLTLTFEPAS
jgi:hypothetical protein